MGPLSTADAAGSLRQLSSDARVPVDRRWHLRKRVSDSPRISESDYLISFPIGKREKALTHAMDIRKFEIDLYWKRATYFWTFIGVSLAGYAAVQASSTIPNKGDLSVFLSCLGIVFSFGWYCVNRGSKQWQENWENHVDMLEDDVIGPLYKTVLRRPKPSRLSKRLIDLATGPSALSVTKINQLISLYVVFLWLVLLVKALPHFSLEAPVNWTYVVMIGAALLACIGFVTLGRTSGGSYVHAASQRKSQITLEDQRGHPIDSQIRR